MPYSIQGGTQEREQEVRVRFMAWECIRPEIARSRYFEKWGVCRVEIAASRLTGSRRRTSMMLWSFHVLCAVCSGRAGRPLEDAWRGCFSCMKKGSSEKRIRNVLSTFHLCVCIFTFKVWIWNWGVLVMCNVGHTVFMSTISPPLLVSSCQEEQTRAWTIYQPRPRSKAIKKTSGHWWLPEMVPSREGLWAMFRA